MRLTKYLAHAGVCSRRAAEVLIAQGRVTVAGQPERNPARDVGDHSGVAVDGERIGGTEPRVAYAVNKPLGVLSTARDPYNRPTVVALVDEPRRLYPVGRLDADSTGLMLLTNDGELAHRLTHPSFEVPKTYLATVSNGPVGERALTQLRKGVPLCDGLTAPAQVRRMGHGRAGAQARPAGGASGHTTRHPGIEVLQITIREGRNRQVRRMCETVGHPVRALQRIAFGTLKLGQLPSGASRRLSEEELRSLRELANTPAATRSTGLPQGKPRSAGAPQDKPRPRSGGEL